VARHVRGVALIGRDATVIESALAGCGVMLHHGEDLPAAVHWCRHQAQAGDAVLLSPACASFDMFDNYGHRAEVFVATVRDMAASEGVA
jgi:UDP-N-acetylmuramoylalanine--D-glutamate ligase